MCQNQTKKKSNLKLPINPILDYFSEWHQLKYEMCSRSVETDAVFSKIEINNESNVNFLQNMRCSQKVSRLKLYWQRQKWARSEALISFKIHAMFRVHQHWGKKLTKNRMLIFFKIKNVFKKYLLLVVVSEKHTHRTHNEPFTL